MIRITNTGDIFVNAVKIVGINYKPHDSVSKILVLAANAVRIVEKNKKASK